MTWPGAPTIDVHLILRSGEEVLLSQRAVGYGQGWWHLPAGKLEPDESLPAAAVREAAEETGVVIAEGDLRLVHTVHYRHAPGGPDRLGFFFEALTWSGEPANLEPDKCLDLRWFGLSRLPAELLTYPALGLRAYAEDRGGLSLHGWSTDLSQS